MCSGWVPSKKPEGGIYGYATDDIFYLETCLYSQVSAIGLGLHRRHHLSPNTLPLILTPTPTANPNRVRNQVCANGRELFRLAAGESFKCHFKPALFRELQELLLTPHVPPGPGEKKCESATFSGT